MPKPKHYSRKQRVGDLIQTTLAEILQEHVKDARFGLITVTGVEVSPDFSHAKIYVSVLNEESAKEAIDVLNQSSREFRFELAHAINLRVTPDLKFFYDDSTVRGNRITSLISKALKD